MNRSHLAAIAAVTFGLTLQASAVYAHGQARQSADATDQTAQSQSDAQTPPAKNDDATGATQSAPTNDQSAQTQAKKHPPTAIMDQATPPDKTTTGKADSEKHPPTSLMDRAAPDEKSPDSTAKPQ
jgi:hypothetical protein